MIMDGQLEFSNSQVVTATADSTNYLNTDIVAGLIGPGVQELEIIIQVDVAAAASGSATVTFLLETDSTSAFSSATTLLTTAAIGKGTLVAGYQVAHWRLPVSAVEQYMQLTYTVASGPLTTGSAFSAFIVREGQTARSTFPGAY